MELSALLVEDDEHIRLALGLALADEGFAVTDAVSGEDALALLEHTAFDVVLLDVMLPGVDGLEVCRTLRARGDVPIIIVSARTDPSDVLAGLHAGADEYVTKPLAAGDLAARIRAVLGRRADPPPDDQPDHVPGTGSDRQPVVRCTNGFFAEDGGDTGRTGAHRDP
ncbi:response regulator [Saccharothrix sp.]|uniref:response regulator transcription factor n=1 Tax=Saccharothrix sp. TaxID=1873460 RepID=UPI002810B031|nr:response regulator [Saccharothrix sp.]